MDMARHSTPVNLKVAVKDVTTETPGRRESWGNEGYIRVLLCLLLPRYPGRPSLDSEGVISGGVGLAPNLDVIGLAGFDFHGETEVGAGGGRLGAQATIGHFRSEERRVGKECR